MIVHLRAALCGVAILCAFSSYGTAKPTNDNDHVSRVRTTSTGFDGAIKKHTLDEERGASIVGAASMYNPFEPGAYEGPIKTASGEIYDLDAWTAAIQTRFRNTFGGIRSGIQYQPAYALVEAIGKKVILKINDVGPLEPGRVIDLSKKAMAYFDPSLQKGVIPAVKITPLDGKQWRPGPLDS